MDIRELKNIKEILDWLIDKFKMERMVYLLATTISIIMLLVSAAVLIYKEGASTEILVMLFGSTGLIGYSVNRVMRMFDQALKVIIEANQKKGGANDTK